MTVAANAGLTPRTGGRARAASGEHPLRLLVPGHGVMIASDSNRYYGTVTAAPAASPSS